MRIGIDMGGTKIEGIALADNGEILIRRRIDTPQNDYDGTVSAIVGIVHRIESDTKQKGTGGVGIPGTISPQTGLVKNANSTWIIGKHFRADCSRSRSTISWPAGHSLSAARSAPRRRPSYAGSSSGSAPSYRRPSSGCSRSSRRTRPRRTTPTPRASFTPSRAARLLRSCRSLDHELGVFEPTAHRAPKAIPARAARPGPAPGRRRRPARHQQA